MKNLLLLTIGATIFLAGACNPPGVTLIMENDFSFEYYDFQTEESDELSSFISSSSSTFSQQIFPADGSGSFILQKLHVLFEIDTGAYELTVPAFRTMQLIFNKRIELADATVIGSDDWGRPLYSYTDPDRYLTDFFPIGTADQSEFGHKFDLYLDAYSFLTTYETVVGPSGADDFIFDSAEIITDDNDRQFLYVEGRFTGKTISMGYPTVPLEVDGVIEVTLGNFKAKWPID
jgi:hypothetical protein